MRQPEYYYNIMTEVIEEISKNEHRDNDNKDHAMYHVKLSEEVGEVAREIVRRKPYEENMRHELIQCLTVILIWMSRNDKNKDEGNVE